MSSSWQSRLDAAIDDNATRLIELRRHLHMQPEPSGKELQTSLKLYQLLSERKLAVKMGPEGCGVVVESRNQPAPRRIAMRADIDALRIQDEKQVPYHSCVPEVMHACGHDVHTSTVFGALTALDQLEREGALPWPVTWRTVFQPAEETSDGARAMIGAGVLKDVATILSLHVDPTRPAGSIGVRPGVFTASCDLLRITVHGRGGHAARPHESADPIAAAVQLISTLYQFIPRATDSQDAVVVSFGQIHGGQNANVIPEQVTLEGTVRTLSPKVRERTIANIRRIVDGIGSVTGTRLELSNIEGIPSVENDTELTELVGRVSRELLGAQHVVVMPRPSMGSEDFASYLEHVPGTMFRLGCAGDHRPWPGLHTPTFDVDEKCITVGAKILAHTVVEWSKPATDGQQEAARITMSKIDFHRNDRPTVGIEIELGLVDAETMALTSAYGLVSARLTSEGHQDADATQYKPELMQCVLEINTDICETIGDAERDLTKKLTIVEAATDSLGLRLWWGATHPFSQWSEQRITPDARYLQLVSLLQEMARRLVTFGLHIHVGVDSGDKAVMICDRIMRHLPTLLSLSVSSPFWEGRNTGLHSHRSKIMEGLPTAGLPTLMRNWSEYVWLVNHMIDTGFINTIREIWWDVRPHHNFGTVEVRICDMPGNLNDVLAIAALVQCLVKSLSDEIDHGTYQHDSHPMMVQQNKWRATRFGNRATLVDTYTYEVASAQQMVERLAELLRPTAADLRCESYLNHCVEMAKTPSAAQRQLDIRAATDDPREVVRQLTEAARVSREEVGDRRPEVGAN